MRSIDLNHNTADKDFLQLQVVSGPQSGVNHSIEENSELTIGNAIDNDIVIFCPDHESTQLLLETHDDQTRVKVSMGSVAINDETLYVDMIHPVKNGDRFVIGSSQFIFRFKQEFTESTASDFYEETMDDKKIGFEGNPITARPLTFLCLGVGMVLLVSAISTGMVSAFSDRSQTPPIQQVINEQGFENLVYQQDNTGKIEKITGSVRNRDEMRRLMDMVSLQNTPAIVDVQVDQDLIDSVVDVYRVNGVKADVSVVGLGEVRVWTSTNKIQLLDTIEGVVKKDLHNVASITRENTPPSEQIVVEENSPVSISDPDKQITLVVAGDAGYLMTKDKSRYFVGSLLPSGHEITRIEGGDVYVSVNGSEIKLDF